MDNKDIEQLMNQSVRDGSFSDALLRKIAEEMGSKTANRVVDVIYPAKVIALTGPQATINRGDGTGIKKGQMWDVVALGEEMIDPDTGESLGGSEVKVGSLRIDRVTPKFSNVSSSVRKATTGCGSAISPTSSSVPRITTR